MKRNQSGFSLPEVLIVLVIVIVFPLVIWSTYAESKSWDSFKSTHDCQVIAQNKGTTSYGMTTNGTMGMIQSLPTTTFKCNDGVTYTR
jgi:Tfp pilus assembly protein PilE